MLMREDTLSFTESVQNAAALFARMFKEAVTAWRAAAADAAVLAPASTAVSDAASIVCDLADACSASADGAAAPSLVMLVWNAAAAFVSLPMEVSMEDSEAPDAATSDICFDSSAESWAVDFIEDDI